MSNHSPFPDRTPWTQTRSGRAVPLVGTQPEHIDFVNDIAPHLAEQVRFCGAAGTWTVADHCTVGADILSRPGLELVALAFLLHDAHEAYIGDITTPTVAALKEHLRRREGVVASDVISAVIRLLKAELDRAIYIAAGLPWPLPDHVAEAVKTHDARMLMTERRDLMAPAPLPWGSYERVPPLRTVGRLSSTGKTPARRAEEWMRRFLRLTACLRQRETTIAAAE